MSEGLKILIADDSSINRLGFKAMLQSLGHRVIAEAENGEEAVELANLYNPDLLLMDINMPLIDGIEAIKRINDKFFIPSIIVSAYHDTELIERASAEGVLYYLVKPVDEKDLSIAIKISMSKAEEIMKLNSELKTTKEALSNRVFIEKAKGILMQRKDLTEPEAMKLLQKISNQKNEKVVQVAKSLIQADELF